MTTIGLGQINKSRVDHYVLARKLNIDHGEAVLAAREFCPSGYVASEHGSMLPCDDCTTKAVLLLAEVLR